MKNTDTGLLAWLGFRRNPDWSRARWLGAGIGLAAMISCAGLLILTLIDLIEAFLRTGPYAQDRAGEGIRNSGLFLVALLGAPFLVWRTVVAQRQAETAEAALFNEKIKGAATGLRARRQVTHLADGATSGVDEWEDDLVARVAAIDGLEGLAEEQPDAAQRIERLLASYVRGTFPARTLEPTEDLQERKLPRLDLQTAVSALGRLHGDLVTRGEVDYRLDLRTCDLDGVDFSGGNFFAADLTGSRMEGAILRNAIFDGAYLWRCLLNFGSFFRCDLSGARLDHAIFSVGLGGWVGGIGLAGSLRGTTFIGTDLRGELFLNGYRHTFGTTDTKLSFESEKAEPSKQVRGSAEAARLASTKNPATQKEQDAFKMVSASNTPRWSPYSSNDGIIGSQLRAFYEALDMKRWPYMEGK